MFIFQLLVNEFDKLALGFVAVLAKVKSITKNYSRDAMLDV